MSALPSILPEVAMNSATERLARSMNSSISQLASLEIFSYTLTGLPAASTSTFISGRSKLMAPEAKRLLRIMAASLLSVTMASLMSWLIAGSAGSLPSLSMICCAPS